MEKSGTSTFMRVSKYVIVRAFLLSISVVIGVFLAIVATNYGGYIDDIFREGVDAGILHLPRSTWDVPSEEKAELLKQVRWEMEEEAGLHKPFLVRCLQWLGYGLTLDWKGAGRTMVGYWIIGTSDDIPKLILGRLQYTLLLAGIGNLLLFIPALVLALVLSKKHSSWLDKLLTTLSPISTIPNWIHGVLLILIFAAGLRILPFGGMFGDQLQETELAYVPIVLKHMILPVAAIFLGSFFQVIYTWRSYFLLHAEEDYVELAEARGLPPRMLERRYILRPALPFILTNFALMLISFWQGAAILEVLFDWPGIGKLFIESIQGLNRPAVVGTVVVFAYILAITIFILDITYAIIDPRVRVEGIGRTRQPVVRRRRRRRSSRLKGNSSEFGEDNGGWSLSKNEGQSKTRGKSLSKPDKRTQLFSEKRRGKKTKRKSQRSLKPTLREIIRYPSLSIGLIIILIMIGISIYAITAAPYNETIELWRGGEDVWYRYPKKAPPEWINFFRKDKLPTTFILDSQENAGTVTKIQSHTEEGFTEITLVFPFHFTYNAFPQDMAIRFDAQYTEKRPYIYLAWRTPDGREIDMGSILTNSSQIYTISNDNKLSRRLGGEAPIQALFSDPASNTPIPLQGTYELTISGILFEEEADLEAEVILHGQIHGLAGTDHRRRDLKVGLLWGMPIALSFGLVGAFVTTISSMIIAAISAWFGGWVDNIIQRISEVYMVLPVIPVCITMYLAADKSIWVILGAVILLTIFGSSIKNYRAIFLQVKEDPYIEAALAYGAGNKRIILHYLVPRIVPVLIPQMVFLIPSYSFLEAMLAYLNVSDPTIPTWGKLMEDGISHGLYTGAYHMLLEPLSLLLLIGLAFVMISLALENIFQSRLRTK